MSGGYKFKSKYIMLGQDNDVYKFKYAENEDYAVYPGRMSTFRNPTGKWCQS